MLPELADLKLFARIDGTDDDATLAKLLAAAIEYVQTATGQDYSTTASERAGVAVMSLATHWFEHPVPTGHDRVVPFHVRSLIHQLRNWEDPAVTEAQA